ncbi:MAG: DUF2066 domain-containing protein [Gammaproteobacteria bacterium]
MLKVSGILLALVLCWPLAGRPAIVTGLYEAEVPVPDQSSASQKQATASALQSVLVKLTGDREVRGRAGTAGLLEHPEQYVQQYKFQKKPVIRNNQLSLAEQLYLWVSFNADILDKALRDNSISQWGKVRPATLIWLVTQQGQERKFVDLEDEQGFTTVLDSHAQRRGIPVMHPLLDNQDRLTVKETDVVGGFPEPLRQASQRYTPDAILIGNITSHTGSWEGHWTALINNEPISWTATGDAGESVLRAGIDRLADELAARFVQAPAIAGEADVEIVVKDINDFDQYSKVLKYLRTLNSVIDVEVRSVEPGSVSYAVTASGGELAVVRAIELGKTLESLSGSGGPYRLVQ